LSDGGSVLKTAGLHWGCGWVEYGVLDVVRARERLSRAPFV